MKLNIYLIVACNIAFFSYSQDNWLGSTISTTTYGSASIGSTPFSTYRLSVFNTNTSIRNGTYNFLVSSLAGTQFSTNNESTFNGTTGVKYGFRNNTTSYSSGLTYGIYNNLSGVGGIRYGIYSYCHGAGNRSAFFDGISEFKGDLILSANTTSKYIFNSAWQTGATYLDIAPNTSDNNEDWNFNVGLRFERDGSLMKKIDSDLKKAFYVYSTYTNQDVFRVMGNGDVYATSIRVRLASNFPDYVFHKNYNLMSLYDLDEYIQINCKLPALPSAENIAKEGMDLGEMNKLLVEKIEQLTLYTIQQQKEIDLLKKEIEKLIALKK